MDSVGWALTMPRRKAQSRRFPVLRTKRLVLREVTRKDARWYFKHFNTWEIIDGQEHVGPRNMKEAREELELYFVDNFRDGTGIRWGVTLSGNDELIGSVGFYKWRKESSQAEAGYDLDPRYWRMGIMTEAMTAIIRYGFGAMRLNRIEVLISPRNRNSLRLVRRLGFKNEGVLREHYFYKGKFTDDVLFSLIKREWPPRLR